MQDATAKAARLARPRMHAAIGLSALVALAGGCAAPEGLSAPGSGFAAGAPKQAAPPAGADGPDAPRETAVRRTPYALAEGFQVVRLEAANWIGCTAIRRTAAPAGGQEGSHLGLVRLQTGEEMMALGGIQPDARLGTRRQVAVRVDVAGSSDTGTGWLENGYFNAFTSADPVPALARGSTATLRFEGGFTVGRRFQPGVVRELARCYEETLVLAGLTPGIAPLPAPRLPVARPAPQPGGLTPDVADVRLE